ncbi:hypothetical protein V1512DRAFT_268016 [Lipomyces arxii]|uniref:uncharacterized protein n=1 Tax=Lipomyces arxii TaxID=56418 RepID=UPI0034CFEEEF
MAEEEQEKSKRKHEEAFDEIEINVNLPEPLSKKELRRRKKAGLPLEPTAEEIAKKTAKNDSTSDPKSIGPVIKKQKEEPKSKRKTEFGIWIGNLSFNMKKDDLRRFFTSKSAEKVSKSDSGIAIKGTDIVRVHMPKNAGGQNKGFAYVDFTSAEALKQAVDLSESVFEGRRVLIKDAGVFDNPAKSDRDASSLKKLGTPTRILFVGNLPFETKSEQLEEIFTISVGSRLSENEYEDGPNPTATIKPTKIRMATFQDTGKCKGFAFIDYATSDNALKVLTKVGTSIKVLDRTGVKVEFGADRSFRWKARLDAAPDLRKADDDSAKIMDSQKRQQNKNKTRLPPGMALANAQRAKVSIQPSEGKKTVFSE